MRAFLLAAGLTLALLPLPAPSLVHYDEGRREIEGVLLLRDTEDPSAYYYVPQFPRLAASADGGLELLCLRYVDAAGGTHGGLFHALVEFTLPAETVALLEARLREEVGSAAHIAGPVPLQSDEGQGGPEGGSFRLVSGVLADAEEGGFTRSVVTSRRAPISAGSRAAIAAILGPRGATLLWESLSGPTSDVSVAISAHYEALVPSYGARVTAQVETVYRHFSLVSNRQEEFRRRQIRDAVDELHRSGGLEIEVFDRAGAGGGDLDAVLDLVTQKLTELLFDHKAGWAADPEREVTVEAGQIRGRQRGGFFSRLFSGAKDRKYYSDDQWVLKNRRDVRRNRFVLDLRRQGTIRVPVETSGNLGGLYGALKEDSRYFRIVPLEDPAFERREVFFQVDGDYLEAFEDTVNLVTVSLRKTYRDRPAFEGTLTFSRREVAGGGALQSLDFPRLGEGANERASERTRERASERARERARERASEGAAGWGQYEVQVRWSLRGGRVISQPAAPGAWQRSSAPAISLAPPLDRRAVEIELASSAFGGGEITSAVVEFATFLAGEPAFRHRAVLRPEDTDTTARRTLYFDRGRPVIYRLSWFGPRGERRDPPRPLESDYLFLVPPGGAAEPASEAFEDSIFEAGRPQEPEP